MERRIRSYVDRQPATTLQGFLKLMERDRAVARRLPRPRDDQRLRAVPQPGAVRRRCARRCCPSCRAADRCKIWSAGCSYGAEAYTLACLVAETLPGQRFEIAGSDIDRRIVERAQRGRFSQADMRHVPPPRARQLLQARRRRLAGRRRAAQAPALPRRGPAARALPDGRSTSSSAATSSSTSTTPPATTCTPASPGRCATGGYFMVGATERVGDPRGMGLQTAYPFIYRKAG